MLPKDIAKKGFLLFFSFLFLFISFFVLSTNNVKAVNFGNILVIEYQCNDLSSYLNSLGGYSITTLTTPAAGVIKTTIESGAYDQVYLFDCFFNVPTVASLTDTGDKDALATWYLGHKGNIVLDARSYGVKQGTVLDKFFIENIASAFATYGGGLWIGVDHNYNAIDGTGDWDLNGNALLTAIGYDNFPINTSNSDAITGGVTSSPFLTTPNVITSSSLWKATVGTAPIGLQSDGTNLKRLVWAGTVSYISFSLNIPPPQPPVTFESENKLEFVTNDIPVILGNVLNFLLGVAGTIALLMLIWGGVIYITSAGDEQKSGAAKKIITWTILGLIVVLSSYAIVKVISGFLT